MGPPRLILLIRGLAFRYLVALHRQPQPREHGVHQPQRSVAAGGELAADHRSAAAMAGLPLPRPSPGSRQSPSGGQARLETPWTSWCPLRRTPGGAATSLWVARSRLSHTTVWVLDDGIRSETAAEPAVAISIVPNGACQGGQSQRRPRRCHGERWPCSMRTSSPSTASWSAHRFAGPDVVCADPAVVYQCRSGDAQPAAELAAAG